MNKMVVNNMQAMDEKVQACLSQYKSVNSTLKK